MIGTSKDGAVHDEKEKPPVAEQQTHGQVAFGAIIDIPASAYKISPVENRLQKNVYGDGYLEFTDYSALSALPNPGYKSASGVPSGRQGAQDANDVLLSRMADRCMLGAGVELATPSPLIVCASCV